MAFTNSKGHKGNMEFHGIQCRCQSCHCHINKDSSGSFAANIQAEDEITPNDSVNIEMTRNQDRSNFLCLYCRMLIEQLSSFLKNVEELDKKDWCRVCHHCREKKSTNQCKRCSYLVSQFKKGKEKCQNIQKWKDMLNKVKLFLETLTADKRYINSSETAPDTEDLVKIFELMQIPSENRVVIKESSDLDVLKYKNMWKYLDDLNQIIESPETSGVCSAKNKMDLIPVQSREKDVCICQKFAEINKNISLATITEEKPLTTYNNSIENVVYSKKIDDVNLIKKLTPKGGKTFKKSNKVPGNIRKIVTKSDKMKAYKSSELVIKIILKGKMNPNRSQADRRNLRDQKRLERYLRSEIDELPPLPVKILEEKTDEESGSVVECKQLKPFEPNVFIQNNKILTQEQNNKQLRGQHRSYRKPLFFQVQHDSAHKTVNISDNDIQKIIEHRESSKPFIAKTPAKYRLSNRKFIEAGFTVLPASKIMRRIKFYNMVSSRSKFDWLEKYKNRKHMYYSSGEKLSEISDDGQIRWYYKDGCLALEFCNTKENTATDEFIIYDSIELRKKSGQPVNNLILACFDKMGHGIVYDRKGSVRLKYNQYEGKILDENVGPTALWKWNNLNEPPEIRHTFVNSYGELDNCPDDPTNVRSVHSLNNEEEPKIFDKQMYAIELDNYMKETLKNMEMKYKQYQIKFKVLKINEHFTLKILEQSKIFLLFKDGDIHFKLNLGLKLMSNEIIDVKTVDFCEVVTPYDNKIY